MKQVRIILSVLSLLSLNMFTSCEPVVYDTFGGISGFVVDFETGDAVANANVTLSPGGLNTFSGEDGFFQFDNLESKQYTLTIQHLDYRTNRKIANVIPGEVVELTLTLTRK